jgi:hypothetical protein
VNVLAIGFPNPVTWVWDKATGMLGGAAGDALGWSFQKVIAGLVAWVLDGVSWVAGAVFGFTNTSTSPKVTAAWFVGDSSHDGPYRVMVGIAASLLLLFLFAGLIQGVLTGDIAGMGRRMVLDLPMAVGGMVSAVAITQLLIDLTDALSGAILTGFGTDIRSFMDGIGAVGHLSGGVATALVVFLLGLFTLLAGLVIFVELVIRSALIYLVVALCPLAFAALLWPATRGVLRRTLELLCALIVSKLVISLALAIGAAALGGAGTAPTAAPQIAPPTATSSAAPADSDAATVTAAAGVLLAGLATFTVACFSPFVILRLFPVVEGAVAAQGLRGGPLRAAQTAMSTKSQLDVSRRFGSGPASGESGTTGAAGSAPTAATGGAAAGPAPVAVAGAAATSAARRAASTAQRHADTATRTSAAAPTRQAERERGDDAHGQPR